MKTICANKEVQQHLLKAIQDQGKKGKNYLMDILFRAGVCFYKKKVVAARQVLWCFTYLRGKTLESGDLSLVRRHRCSTGHGDPLGFGWQP